MKGQKRSENLIQLVNHKDKQAQVVGFYNGNKESEKTVVKNYIDAQNDLTGQGISMDALHTDCELLSKISNKGGHYLAQVKGNQPKLLEECRHIHANMPARYEFQEVEKGHGRVETRTGSLYCLNPEGLESRWLKSGIKTLVVVKRQIYHVKKKKNSTETAFYITNLSLTEKFAESLFHMPRKHWGIEIDNGVRDNNFGEDNILSFHQNLARGMAVFITWTLNLLRRNNKQNNISALREDIAADRSWLYTVFKAE